MSHADMTLVDREGRAVVLRVMRTRQCYTAEQARALALRLVEVADEISSLPPEGWGRAVAPLAPGTRVAKRRRDGVIIFGSVSDDRPRDDMFDAMNDALDPLDAERVTVKWDQGTTGRPDIDDLFQEKKA